MKLATSASYVVRNGVGGRCREEKRKREGGREGGRREGGVKREGGRRNGGKEEKEGGIGGGRVKMRGVVLLTLSSLQSGIPHENW